MAGWALRPGTEGRGLLTIATMAPFRDGGAAGSWHRKGRRRLHLRLRSPAHGRRSLVPRLLLSVRAAAVAVASLLLLLAPYRALFARVLREVRPGTGAGAVRGAVAAADREGSSGGGGGTGAPRCRCVNCPSDRECGGLWKGASYPGGRASSVELGSPTIRLVVSHCRADLSWISSFVEGYNVTSVHVTTKCGRIVNGAPSGATVERLPNVGRCDHTYAHYLADAIDWDTNRDDSSAEDDNIVVFFLKDDMSPKSNHQMGTWIPFSSMLKLASSTNGFACAVHHDKLLPFFGTWYDLSPYHDRDELRKFSMESYELGQTKYQQSYRVRFKSRYANLGEFYDDALMGGIGTLPKAVQVCYGGIFAAKLSRVKRAGRAVWRSAERALERGDNIEEGHFMERLWGALLAEPLEPHQAEGLLGHAEPDRTGFYENLRGVLFREATEEQQNTQRMEKPPLWGRRFRWELQRFWKSIGILK